VDRNGRRFGWRREWEIGVLDAPALPGMRAAERFCEDMARREAANFYWGFIALPRQQRIAIYALYDFARQVDDDADLEGRSSRHARLDHHRRRLRETRPGDTTDPVMGVLALAMRRYSIPIEELDMLIDGVAMDLTTTRYSTWDELGLYANLVASVVGRMCVRIFGFRDPIALERADELGVALQLINILRDVREDAARGRIYLPADELAAYGISEHDILEGRAAPGWNQFMAMQAARARRLHASGLRVTESIPTQPAVCVRTMAGIYLGILERIEAAPDLPLRGRARLSKAAKLGVMARSWWAAV
jgi:phytoene synthase